MPFNKIKSSAMKCAPFKMNKKVKRLLPDPGLPVIKMPVPLSETKLPMTCVWPGWGVQGVRQVLSVLCNGFRLA